MVGLRDYLGLLKTDFEDLKAKMVIAQCILPLLGVKFKICSTTDSPNLQNPSDHFVDSSLNY